MYSAGISPDNNHLTQNNYMQKIKNMLAIALVLLAISSCEKDEGNLPSIIFKTGGSYISADDTISAGSAIVIGINASKSEDRDVLKKFNISKSVNGAAAVSLLNKDLSKDEEDNFSFDFSSSLDSAVNQSSKYTFTVTNRDGLVNTVSVTLVGK